MPNRLAILTSLISWLKMRFALTLFALTWLMLSSPRCSALDAWYPLEAASTDSPRATLQSFLNAWEDLSQQLQKDGEYAEFAVRRVVSCLDLSEVAPTLRRGVAGESAVCLKEVLDRLQLPPWDEIPDEEQIRDEGNGDELERWRLPRTEIIFVRVKEGPRTGEYLFSPDTVDRASEFYHLVKHLPYQSNATPGLYDWYLSDAGSLIPDRWIHSLPSWTRQLILETPLWKWVGLAVTLFISLGLMLLIYRLGRRLAHSVRETSVFGYLATLLFPIAAVTIPVLAKYVASSQLSLRGNALNVVTILLDLIFLLTVIVVVMGIGNRVAEMIIAQPRIHPKGLDAQFIRVACQLTSLVAAVIVFLEGGRQLGIPLTTLLAGAGVGGLTIALAAQDTLKNLFGSMMIFLDKPYRVGERILVKGFDGVVEEIGLRSTKIRLLTGHQALIPNEEMARSHIENIGRRPHIRRATDIALELNTPPDKVEQAVEIIRGLLANHEGMEPEFPPRVYFDEFNRDSLRVRIIYWYHPPNYWEFVAFGEKLNVRIMRELRVADIQLALPANVTYMSIEEKDLTDSAETPDSPS